MTRPMIRCTSSSSWKSVSSLGSIPPWATALYAGGSSPAEDDPPELPGVYGGGAPGADAL